MLRTVYIRRGRGPPSGIGFALGDAGLGFYPSLFGGDFALQKVIAKFQRG